MNQRLFTWILRREDISQYFKRPVLVSALLTLNIAFRMGVNRIFFYLIFMKSMLDHLPYLASRNFLWRSTSWNISDERLSASDSQFGEKAESIFNSLIPPQDIFAFASHWRKPLVEVCYRKMCFEHGGLRAGGKPYEVLYRFSVSLP